MQSLRAISLGLFAAMVMLIAAPLRAEEQADTGFAKRFFAGNAGQPKAYACFTRRYDAAHMAEHPQQKVTMMRLLITSEKMPDDQYLDYSFRLGVNFRDLPGDFDSSGECGHAPTVRDPDTDSMPAAGIDFQCDVDCDGGGIAVNLANSDSSLIVKLDSRSHLEEHRSGWRSATGLARRRRRQDIQARPHEPRRMQIARHRSQGTRRDAA